MLLIGVNKQGFPLIRHCLSQQRPVTDLCPFSQQGVLEKSKYDIQGRSSKAQYNKQIPLTA